MSDTYARVPLAVARDAIARCVTRTSDPCELRIGDITLHAHQRSAVDRLRQLLAASGGALLCDDVGLGKTYIALGVAARFEGVLVVAPSVLLPMWRSALAITRVDARTISLESLGRTGIGGPRPALTIVDEAHHFRNQCTRRYAALASTCASSAVLLLSATPLHNSRDDIAALAALFVGSRAYSMSDAELGKLMVRRNRDEGYLTQRVPVVEHTTPRVLATDEHVLDRILALPPPVPPSGGSVATRLVVHGLARQWVSSHAALVGALRRRIARSHALLSALDGGRYPTAAELCTWVYGGGAVQLAFTELLVPESTPADSLSAALRSHVSGLEELLAHVVRLDDDAAARLVREIRAVHSREKIVVFTQYAETANALYGSMERHGHAALLTAHGATIATGPVARAEVLRQFVPESEGNDRVADHARIDLLICTDVLSEGVNLHAASVVIHLDLPWTQARMHQRTGRLARLGSPHARVMAYYVHPPPRAEAVLRELDIIARKSALSSALLGSETIAAPAKEWRAHGSVSHGEQVRSTLETWVTTRAVEPECQGPLVGLAQSDHFACAGVWTIRGEAVLLALLPSGDVSADMQHVADAIGVIATAVNTDGQGVDDAALDDVMRAAERWHARLRARHALGACATPSHPTPSPGTAQRLVRVADAAISAARFADRSRVARVATRLRQAACTPLPVAVEWSLESMTGPADEATVDTILELIERARRSPEAGTSTGFKCVAVIVVRGTGEV